MTKRNKQKTFIRKQSLIAWVGILIVSAVFGLGGYLFYGSLEKDTSAPTITVTEAPAVEASMLEQVNKVRAEAGKEALAEDTRLNAAAQQKLELLVGSNTFEHQAPNGEHIFLPIRKQFPRGYKLAGENLAKCTTSTTELVAGWAASPGHYRVMIGDYNGWGYAQLQNPVDKCTWSINVFIKY